METWLVGRDIAVPWCQVPGLITEVLPELTPVRTCETMQPRVCLGMPLYNQTEFLKVTLASLLAQTYRNFRLVIVDDSTEPEPGKIAREFAAKDSRIWYVKNEARKGLIGNWKACLHHAGEAEYFAWVSDHDLWHPRWLEEMLAILDAAPRVVLAYPRTVHVSLDGEKIAKKGRYSLSTDGLSEFDRVSSVFQDGPGLFGKMVYGLFRARDLRRCGALRRVLFPDALLLLELCFYGEFHQVDKELWFRRTVHSFSISRQKKSLFVRKPWYIYLPWPFVNAAVLAWNTAIRSEARGLRLRLLALRQTLVYLRWSLDRLGEGGWIGSFREWRKGKKPWIRRIKYRLRHDGAKGLKGPRGAQPSTALGCATGQPQGPGAEACLSVRRKVQAPRTPGRTASSALAAGG